MKNIIASTGLVALGIASLQPNTETNADPNPNTPWSISASLRGFYDDNIATVPDTQSSYGVSVSPSVNFNTVREQGEIGLGYTFGLKWYVLADNVKDWVDNVDDLVDNVDRELDRAGQGLTIDPNNVNNLRQQIDLLDETDHLYNTEISHTVAARIAHSFSPTFSFELANNFRIAQEPEIEAGTVRRGGNRDLIRGKQDYLHNQARFYATQMLSETYSVYAGYANTVFRFDDPDFSRHLDRMEHTPLIHLKAQLKPNTVGLIGYRFKAVDYPGDEVLVPGDPRFGRETLNSDVRDSDSHYVYAGLDHAFTPTLQGSVRLGAQFTKFVNADDNPRSTIDDATSPFADANLSYGYAEGSHFQIGVKHERNRHDLAYGTAVVPNDPILDQEQTVVYASVNHQLTAKLNGSLVGHYLNGTYEGGGTNVDGKNDEYWAFGLSLDYAINPYLAAEAGYNFDDYESGVLSEFRSYDRNRVYVGLRASY